MANSDTIHPPSRSRLTEMPLTFKQYDRAAWIAVTFVQASGMRVASNRDLAFVIDSNGYRWARLMHNLLREICHAVNQSETVSEAE